VFFYKKKNHKKRKRILGHEFSSHPTDRVGRGSSPLIGKRGEKKKFGLLFSASATRGSGLCVYSGSAQKGKKSSPFYLHVLLSAW